MGSEFYKDGSWYKGEWENNLKNGEGTFFNKTVMLFLSQQHYSRCQFWIIWCKCYLFCLWGRCSSINTFGSVDSLLRRSIFSLNQIKQYHIQNPFKVYKVTVRQWETLCFLLFNLKIGYKHKIFLNRWR